MHSVFVFVFASYWKLVPNFVLKKFGSFFRSSLLQSYVNIRFIIFYLVSGDFVGNSASNQLLTSARLTEYDLPLKFLYRYNVSDSEIQSRPTWLSRLFTQVLGKLTVISKIKVDQNWENQEKYIHFFFVVCTSYMIWK